MGNARAKNIQAKSMPWAISGFHVLLWEKLWCMICSMTMEKAIIPTIFTHMTTLKQVPICILFQPILSP